MEDNINKNLTKRLISFLDSRLLDQESKAQTQINEIEDFKYSFFDYYQDFKVILDEFPDILKGMDVNPIEEDMAARQTRSGRTKEKDRKTQSVKNKSKKKIPLPRFEKREKKKKPVRSKHKVNSMEPKKEIAAIPETFNCLKETISYKNKIREKLNRPGSGKNEFVNVFHPPKLKYDPYIMRGLGNIDEEMFHDLHDKTKDRFGDLRSSNGKLYTEPNHMKSTSQGNIRTITSESKSTLKLKSKDETLTNTINTNASLGEMRKSNTENKINIQKRHSQSDSIPSEDNRKTSILHGANTIEVDNSRIISKDIETLESTNVDNSIQASGNVTQERKVSLSKQEMLEKEKQKAEERERIRAENERRRKEEEERLNRERIERDRKKQEEKEKADKERKELEKKKQEEKEKAEKERVERLKEKERLEKEKQEKLAEKIKEKEKRLSNRKSQDFNSGSEVNNLMQMQSKVINETPIENHTKRDISSKNDEVVVSPRSTTKEENTTLNLVEKKSDDKQMMTEQTTIPNNENTTKSQINNEDKSIEVTKIETNIQVIKEEKSQDKIEDSSEHKDVAKQQIEMQADVKPQEEKSKSIDSNDDDNIPALEEKYYSYIKV